MKQPLSIPRIIERPHLRHLLLDSLENRHVLLTAPAGYGKSTALRELTRHLPHVHLITMTLADLDVSVLQARLGSLPAAPDVILLDDVHLLAGGSEVCTWLQQQLATNRPRWLLAGRTIPFHPELLLLSGQVVRLDKEVLAFSLAETAVLLAKPESQIANWHERLRGWSLAVSLLSRLPPGADPLPTTEAHLFTYLTQAVFAQLSPELKRFMQVTAVPLRFNQDLAAALWDGLTGASSLLNEIIRADLYIQPAGKPDWYRYHDLIRDYLLQDFAGRKVVAETAVTWFKDHDELNTAVDQALDSGHRGLAAQLIGQMPLGRFHGNNSYLTYRRWIRALDDAALAADPMLLVRLANVLQMIPGYVAEARAYAEQGVRLAAEQRNTKVALLAKTNLAHWHYQQGNLEIGRQLIRAVLANPGCIDYPRLFALRIASLILSDAGYYNEARPYYEQAIALAYEMNTHNEPFMNKANIAAKYWLPLGRMEMAQQQLTEVLTHFAGSPGWMGQYLLYWCELQTVQGDWPELAQTLNRIAETLADVETITIHSQVWLAHYQTVQAVMADDDAQFQSALARYASLIEAIPLNQDCVAWLACWYWRRRGQWDDVRQRGQRALAQPTQFADYRAQVALEMDIAQAMQHLDGDRDDFAVHEETRQFIHWRSRHQLLRLRALLAIVCWHRGDWRWRRHWTAVTRQLQKPTFTHQLTRRDPELGVRFWQIGLVEEIDVDRATAVLTQIGQYDPLLPLLKHEKPAVRQRAATILAQIGDERAMVGLTAVHADEKHPTTRQAIETALIHLENQPPPPLTIRLMGDFSLQRGDEIIPANAWHRPIVLRLFHYFALNAGRPLTKEQILDDLWADTDPANAWTTFRTVYSRLRKLLEPAMRPKTANRYVSLNGDAYTFDPDGRADIDVQHFQQIVEDVLQKRDEQAITAVPEPLVTMLESYAPLLPDHPYAEWLLEPRQRLEALYVEGCLYLAQAYLVQGKNGTAVTWARRTVTTAPWLEEAYQLLMRAYARQGQRVLALRVSDEAAANLKRELDLEPSPLTQWLADTLRAGKSI